MKIAIGTKNPAKIKGVKDGLNKVWNNKKLIIESFEVDSSVSNQPMSNEETIQGALNRARNSLKMMNGDLGIGLEGGVFENNLGTFLTGWVVVIDKNGKIGIGGGCSLQLPDFIAEELKKGKELGPVMDNFTGEHNMKHKGGSVGFFTNNIVQRSQSFERMTIYALAKFINPQLY